MMFRTKPHDVWRRRFAFIPVKIGENQWLWWTSYERRWVNDSQTEFERRAVVDGKEFTFRDRISCGY